MKEKNKQNIRKRVAVQLQELNKEESCNKSKLSEAEVLNEYIQNECSGFFADDCHGEIQIQC